MKTHLQCAPGFSLLEILITLSIIFICVALAIPSQHAFLSSSKDQVIIEQLLRAVSLARSESQARGFAVSLCQSVDHASCSGNRQSGQILFVDETEKGKPQNKDHVLAVFNAISTDGILRWRSSLGRPYLQLLPSGLTPGENGTFWFCPHEAKNPRWAIRISQSGRARVVYPDASGKIASLVCNEQR